MQVSTDIIHDAKFVGKTMLGKLDEELRVKLQFISTHTSSQYDTVQATIINRILDNAGIGEGQDVLDVACGTGVLCRVLHDRGIRSRGMDLSEGMIAIARAAVADPPVMILDEATSSIDTRTEKLVQDGMDKLMQGRTTFVIAHRLSTVMNSDCIMVLDHGHIIERGSHEDLIAEKGTYYQLYTGAFELE